MKKSIIFLLHGGFWLGNALLLLLILTVLSQGGIIEETEGLYFLKVAIGLFLIPGLSSFYWFYHFLFPAYLPKRKLTPTIVCALAISFMSSLVGMVALYFLLDLVWSCYQESNYIVFPILMSISMLYGIVGIVIKGFITSRIACRVHKSFMIALDKIKSIERGKVNIEDKYIPISATYKDRFFQRINN